jgi:hypothetical protein
MDEPHREFAFEAYGARVGIRTAERVDVDVHSLLPPLARPIGFDALDSIFDVGVVPSSSQPRYRLSRDGARIGDSRDLEKVTRALGSELHFRVALSARGLLFVHAGVVRVDGAALVIPGRSLAGKSSLVLGLVGAGAEYFSDEYAVFDPEGRVHPYPKPLSERQAHGPPRVHSPESLGWRTDQPSESAALGLVVVTEFRDGVRWNPRRITPAEAMMALFDNTLVARSHPEFALRVLAAAVSGAGGVAGDRPEADRVAGALLDALRAEGR